MSKPEGKPPPQPNTFTRRTYAEMLTPEDIEALRQKDNALADAAERACAHLRPGPDDASAAHGQQVSGPVRSSAPDMLTPDELEVLRQKDRETAAAARKAFAHLRQERLRPRDPGCS